MAPSVRRPGPVPPGIRLRDVRGFSFPEMVVVVAILAIVGAVAVPSILNMLPEMRVGMSVRSVERQLQLARLKAVSTNRTIRVRFNCPAAGQFRMVELIGTPDLPAADDADGAAATRCSSVKYPFPDTAPGVFDVPNHDGPIQYLDRGVTFVLVQAIEFRPNGTAHVNTGATKWTQIPENAPARITLRRTDGSSAAQAASLRTIEVNGLGRIRIN